jgi:hypothetical protein
LEGLDTRQGGLSKAHAELLERLRTPAASRAPLYLAAGALALAALSMMVALLR